MYKVRWESLGCRIILFPHGNWIFVKRLRSIMHILSLFVLSPQKNLFSLAWLCDNGCIKMTKSSLTILIIMIHFNDVCTIKLILHNSQKMSNFTMFVGLTDSHWPCKCKRVINHFHCKLMSYDTYDDIIHLWSIWYMKHMSIYEIYDYIWKYADLINTENIVNHFHVQCSIAALVPLL